MKRRVAQKQRPIRMRLLIEMICLIVPIFSLFLVNNIYMAHLAEERESESRQNTLRLYQTEIDRNLTEIASFLSSRKAFDTQLQILAGATNLNDYTMAKYNFWTSMTQACDAYKLPDSFFAYSVKMKDYISINTGNAPIQTWQSLSAYLSDNCENGLEAGKWNVFYLHGNFYAAWITSYDGIYLGAWFQLDKLLQPLKASEYKDDIYSVCSHSGQLLCATGNAPVLGNKTDFRTPVSLSTGQYMVSGVPMESADLSFVTFSLKGFYLKQLPLIEKFLLLLLLFAASSVLFIFWDINRTVRIPLGRMTSVMKKVQNGDMEVRMPEKAGTTEFAEVQKTFNLMMDRTRQLKIEVYEQKLKRQEAEAERLQLQIRPHFFIGCLNVIFNFAISRNYKMIQEMAGYLSEHLRFVLRRDAAVVALKDELHDVETFLHIQELRFSKSVEYLEQVPDSLSETPVPILAVFTFVENSVKYAFEGKSLQIRVSAFQSEEGTLCLTVADSGKGFPPDVLGRLKKSECLTDGSGHHLGIWNLVERMRFLYGEDFSIEFRNGENGGAEVCLQIPIQKKRQE